jgi:serine beta-lactamase-like protein LACTB, mitochondrial
MCHARMTVLALIPLFHGCATHRFPAEAAQAAPVATSEVSVSVRPLDADASAIRVSNRILSALVEANGVPGMGAAVWRDGHIVWTGSAGFRDLELERHVDANTIFRLASVSKVVAATAAARLREQDLLDIGAPVQSILGYLPDRWPPITTVQLASHTSGIPHYQAQDENRGGHRFATMREAVGIFQDRDLLFTPRTNYTYSSYGYTLLSAVVEESSGQPYLDYLSREIVSGLRIGPDATNTDDPDASRAYEFSDGAIQSAAPHDFSYSWGGAGLGATAPDLARFGGRLLSGEIVSPETFEWMLVPATLADGSNVMDRENAVGFGWRIGRDVDGDRITHHAGVASGARSALILYPDRKLAVSLLSNALWVSSIEQTALVLAAPFKPRDLAAAVPCPIQAVAYAGDYDGDPVSGVAQFALEDGVCTAVITPPEALMQWLNGFPQKDATQLRIIGIYPNGDFARAALVTPIGVYDFRAQLGGRHHIASFGGTRELSISFLERQ